MNQEDKKYMYRTKEYSSTKIEKFEITGKTEKMVFYRSSSGEEFKRVLTGFDFQWHETWKEARDYLLKRAEQKIALADSTIEWQRKIIRKLSKLEPDAG